MPPPSELSTENPAGVHESADENNIEYAVTEERGGLLTEQFDPDPLAPSGVSVLRATTRGEERVVTSIQLETMLNSADPDAAATIESGWRVLLHTIDPHLSAEEAEAALDTLDTETLSQITQDPGAGTALLAEWTGKATCTTVYITQTVVLSCELT